MANNDEAIMEELKKQAGEEAEIKIDAGAFAEKEESTDEASEKKDDEAPKEQANPLSQKNRTLSVDEAMSKLGISKEDVFELIMEISDNGFIREEHELFGGAVKVEFKTSTLKDSSSFINLFDGLAINTQAKAEYYLNLYSVAGILEMYKDTDLSEMEVTERAGWVEENIPTPIYKTILREAAKFHMKIEILGSEEVADFF